MIEAILGFWRQLTVTINLENMPVELKPIRSVQSTLILHYESHGFHEITNYLQ